MTIARPYSTPGAPDGCICLNPRQHPARQISPDFSELDRIVAQARVVLSLLVLLSLYVDPSTGGLFDVTKWQFITLACHLFYSSSMYLVLRRGVHIDSVRKFSIALDLLFATALAFVTEGRTSPSFVLFVFAIVAGGLGASLRDTVLTASCSVLLYILVIAFSNGPTSDYLMRAVYLAMAGFVIGFFGQQRANFETRLRALEAAAEREAIARSLHDGYIQALAGISLRLESCRDMLTSHQPAEALTEIKEIQTVVDRQYDEVREYVRSLAHAEVRPRSQRLEDFNTQFRIQALFAGPGPMIEHIMQIVLEGVRNTQRHSHARVAAINVQQVGEAIRVTIDDDGVGFPDSMNPPWTIASRVAESGGRLVIGTAGPGAHLEIAIPSV
jgi:signal transduction histidine kinase